MFVREPQRLAMGRACRQEAEGISAIGKFYVNVNFLWKRDARSRCWTVPQHEAGLGRIGWASNSDRCVRLMFCINFHDLDRIEVQIGKVFSSMKCVFGQIETISRSDICADASQRNSSASRDGPGRIRLVWKRPAPLVPVMSRAAMATTVLHQETDRDG
jgi:hypothetical protein